jgi:hypothetical protein
VLIEVFSLELQNVFNQQFSILIGYPDEAAMEAIRVRWIDDGIDTQHLEAGLKEHLTRKEYGAGENFIDFEDLVECDADAATADVDGPLDERFLSRDVLRLKTDGQGDGDTIKLSAIFGRRLRSRGIRWHGVRSIPKWKRWSIDQSSVNP